MRTLFNHAIVEKCPEDGTLWIYYKPGWKSGTDYIGTQHQDHVDTEQEAKRAIQNALPCKCPDCQRA